MHSEQEHPRTRPRVSRACERCRVKKAKCDGERPCKRCNLDKALCSYKVRRKPESVNASQRYTDLLLQHHAALTAGILELYSRLLNGQQWEGPPVEEVNGSPSVHCILERLGVVESEDDIDPNPDPSAVKCEPISPLNPKTVRPIPKVKKPLRPMTRKGSEAPESIRSPVSTTTSRTGPRTIAPDLSPFDTDESFPSAFMMQAASQPSSSGARSGSFDSCGHSTWDSPGFSEELFTTPIPTPTTSPICTSQYQESRLPSQIQTQTQTQTQTRYSGLANQPNYVRDSIPTPLLMPYTSSPDTGTEGCNAGYFFDAAGGMGLYGWDGNGVGFGSVGQDYSAWDSGVFV
ncbi:uncharacterized protein Z518_08852 [Rhinocladiella mackenziei CBS 650.93]|uniref:Zn(2)-C6 fungal-type domain-containing protein n=1 Tax=Rhinocladiella mackenziei CBS 650.93 TaxID=1442369 RepID=A0A0D2IAP5_9EURO|nr:uncharacterized protein Z518_08852 [Rhinocladiella mackenziei CBS 650.93]KIX02909.1 hypothetical protein Z518_08852 [Rhinocladiella mackenziei CBS 650.93]